MLKGYVVTLIMIANSIYCNSLKRVVNEVSVDKKAFLVTGASGLIGSCLVDLLMLANQEGKKTMSMLWDGIVRN